MTKDEVIGYISTLVNFAIADANTFLYAKCNPSFENDNKKVLIGGGNFTVLQITLSAIELLAQVDVRITSKPSDYYSDTEIESIKTAKKKLDKLRSCLDLNLEKNLIEGNFFSRVPSPFDLKIGSGKVISDFLQRTTRLTGLTTREADELVRVRNKLAHEFTPKTIAACSIPPVPGADFISLINNYNKDVYAHAQNRRCIDSHALNHKLEPLLNYVVKNITDLDENTGNFTKILAFIASEK